MAKATLNIRIDDKTKDMLRELAELEHRDMTAELMYLIEKRYKEIKKEPQE